MAKVKAADLRAAYGGDEGFIRLAMIGAELDYERLVRRQHELKAAFPGIESRVMLKMKQARAAHARSARWSRRRAKHDGTE